VSLEDALKTADEKAAYYHASLTGSSNNRAKAELGLCHGRSCGRVVRLNCIWPGHQTPAITKSVGLTHGNLPRITAQRKCSIGGGCA
jgi:hypothetical protein